jgi:Zn-dependent protease with chaperone function
VITPLLLVGFAVSMATIGAWTLQGAAWPRRCPALGILAWQALAASVLLSVTLAGSALALPTLPTTDLADWLGACAVALRAHYATPGGAAVAGAGAALAAGVTLRLASCLATQWLKVSRTRRRLRRQLGILGRPGDHTGVLVVEHPAAAAYCLPGRGGTVVVTRGALQALEAPQLAAVLAHERAHLGDRHDLVLVMANGMRRAFGFVPAFRWAASETAQLVEMRADDTALAVTDRHTLASALVCLAGGSHPVGTLAAGGQLALARVQRLAAPRSSLGAVRSIAAVLCSLAAISLPLVLALAPAVSAAAMDYCPLVFPA